MKTKLIPLCITDFIKQSIQTHVFCNTGLECALPFTTSLPKSDIASQTQTFALNLEVARNTQCCARWFLPTN